MLLWHPPHTRARMGTADDALMPIYCLFCRAKEDGFRYRLSAKIQKVVNDPTGQSDPPPSGPLILSTVILASTRAAVAWLLEVQVPHRGIVLPIGLGLGLPLAIVAALLLGFALLER